jgi:hypothetical protein
MPTSLIRLVSTYRWLILECLNARRTIALLYPEIKTSDFPPTFIQSMDTSTYNALTMTMIGLQTRSTVTLITECDSQVDLEKVKEHK